MSLKGIIDELSGMEPEELNVIFKLLGDGSQGGGDAGDGGGNISVEADGEGRGIDVEGEGDGDVFESAPSTSDSELMSRMEKLERQNADLIKSVNVLIKSGYAPPNTGASGPETAHEQTRNLLDDVLS